MYTNLYVYKAPRRFMSGKLYWRIKKDGKWTWRPAKSMEDVPLGAKFTTVYNLEEEE